jgi:PKD repeat protein
VFTVSLTVSGACGSDVLTRTNYITVSSGYTATTTGTTYTCDAVNRLTQAGYSDGGWMYSSVSFVYAYDAMRRKDPGNDCHFWTLERITGYAKTLLPRFRTRPSWLSTEPGWSGTDSLSRAGAVEKREVSGMAYG